MDQISSAMGQMEKVTQSNAANAEEVAAASEELSAQSNTLTDLVMELRRMIGAKADGRKVRSLTGKTSSAGKAYEAPDKPRALQPGTRKPLSRQATAKAIPFDDDDFTEF